MGTGVIESEGGALLEFSDSGGDGRVLVSHGGTPDGLASFSPFEEAATELGLRVVSIARPGYESSSPQPGRVVRDVVDDVSSVLDLLGVSRYVAMGWSGGGPHALACRAVDPDRCVGAVVVSGLAPVDLPGFDFFEGMGEENAYSFRMAMDDPDALRPHLESMRPTYASITADQLVASMESVLPEVDRKYLTGDFADFVATALRRGTAGGVEGWLDDALALARPWGFDLHDLDRVSIWHGSEDLMVPHSHGRVLAGACGDALPHLLTGEGHLSLFVGRISEIVSDAAGLFET